MQTRPNATPLNSICCCWYWVSLVRTRPQRVLRQELGRELRGRFPDHRVQAGDYRSRTPGYRARSADVGTGRPSTNCFFLAKPFQSETLLAIVSQVAPSISALHLKEISGDLRPITPLKPRRGL
jgi:hypothetical protein